MVTAIVVYNTYTLENQAKPEKVASNDDILSLTAAYAMSLPNYQLKDFLGPPDTNDRWYWYWANGQIPLLPAN